VPKRREGSSILSPGGPMKQHSTQFLNDSEVISALNSTSFGLNQDSINFRKYVSLNREVSTELYATAGLSLRDYGDQLAIVDDGDQRVKLYIMLKVWSALGKRAVTQTALWRDRDEKMNRLIIHGKRVTDYLFSEVLLKKFGLVVSDRMQTPLGREYWVERVANSLADGLCVYRLDLTAKKAYRVSSRDEIENERDVIWGDGESFRTQRLAIATSALWK